MQPLPALARPHKFAQPHAAPHRQRLRTCVASRLKLEDSGRDHFPLNHGLHLSIFHPFKRLPPEGTTLPKDEEMCDPDVDRCKTPAHVYEARCVVCYGTGWARSPTNGRRGNLCTCLVCDGLGFVRRTTSRFCPDDPEEHRTLVRPPMEVDSRKSIRGQRPQGASGNDAAGRRSGSSGISMR